MIKSTPGAAQVTVLCKPKEVTAQLVDPLTPQRMRMIPPHMQCDPSLRPAEEYEDLYRVIRRRNCRFVCVPGILAITATVAERRRGFGWVGGANCPEITIRE